MKNKIINRILLVAVMLLGLSSCEDREIITVDNGNAPIIMDLSTSTLNLDSNFPDNPALTVSWNPASYTVPTEIKYKIQASATEDFSNPQDMGTTDKSIRTQTFTTAQMNTAAKSIGLLPGVPAKMYLRVQSFLGTGALVETSNVTYVTITPYVLVYPTFYLVGEAAYMGWNAGSAQKFYKDENFSYMYTYLEKDKNFRFLGQQDWNPINYSIDLDGTRDAYRYFKQVSSNIIQAPGGDDENMRFTGDTGIYKITINADKSVQSLKAEASAIPGYDFPTIYFNKKGDAPESAVAMTKTSLGVYEYTTPLSNGVQFKFLGQQSAGDLEWGNISKDGDTGYLGPKGDNGYIQKDGNGDNYKITVNLKAGVYTLTKL